MKVYMDIGRYEADFHGTDLLNASRRIKEILLDHRCEVLLIEVNEGHGWRNWRARTGEGLKYLFGVPG